MSGVTNPWKSAFGVDEMTDRDFERRTESFTWNFHNIDKRPAVRVLADEWDITVSKTVDRIIRYYLAHLRDTVEQYADISERHNVHSTLPPSEYVERRTDVGIESVDGQKGVSVTPAVLAMMDEVVNDDDIEASTRKDMAVEATQWFVGQADKPKQ